jgi:hypothetical protein
MIPKSVPQLVIFQGPREMDWSFSFFRGAGLFFKFAPPQCQPDLHFEDIRSLERYPFVATQLSNLGKDVISFHTLFPRNLGEDGNRIGVQGGFNLREGRGFLNTPHFLPHGETVWRERGIRILDLTSI